MSDLGDELRSTIEGAATPVTLDELATRTSSHERRDGRAPWRTFVAGVAAAVLVIVGAVVVVNLGDDDPPPTRIAAPTVVVGDIDLAVLSTSFDDDGARGPIDPSVVDAVRAVPGVAGAQGAMQRFVDVVPTALDLNNQPPASERSAIAISWEDGAPLAFSAGGPPQAAGEVAINQSLAAQYQIGVGAEVSFAHRPAEWWRAAAHRPERRGRDRTRRSEGLDRARRRRVHARGRRRRGHQPRGDAGRGPRHRHQQAFVRPHRHRRDEGRRDRRPDRPRLRGTAGRDDGGSAERDRVRRAVALRARDPACLPRPPQPRSRPPARRHHRRVRLPGSPSAGAAELGPGRFPDREHRTAGLSGHLPRRRHRDRHLPRVLRRQPVARRAQAAVGHRRARRRILASLPVRDLRARASREAAVHLGRQAVDVVVHLAAERVERRRFRAGRGPSVPGHRRPDDERRAAPRRHRPQRAAPRRDRRGRAGRRALASAR